MKSFKQFLKESNQTLKESVDEGYRIHTDYFMHVDLEHFDENEDEPNACVLDVTTRNKSFNNQYTRANTSLEDARKIYKNIEKDFKKLDNEILKLQKEYENKVSSYAEKAVNQIAKKYNFE